MKIRKQIHYNQLDQLFSITDLQDFMGIMDSVYSPIYPLGSIVELGLKLLPEELQKSLAEGQDYSLRLAIRMDFGF